MDRRTDRGDGVTAEPEDNGRRRAITHTEFGGGSTVAGGDIVCPFIRTGDKCTGKNLI